MFSHNIYSWLTYRKATASVKNSLLIHVNDTTVLALMRSQNREAWAKKRGRIVESGPTFVADNIVQRCSNESNMYKATFFVDYFIM